MPWVKLSDNYPEDPRFDEAGPLALALHTAALCHCSRNLTDGRLVRGAARRLLDLDDPGAVMDALVTAGLWEAVDDGKAYQLVDYLEHQPSAEEVTAKREFDRSRKERQRLHNAKDHSLCDPDRCWALNGKARPSGTGSGTPHGVAVGVQPSRPDPSRPDPKGGTGEGRAAGAGSRSASPAGGSPREEGAPCTVSVESAPERSGDEIATLIRGPGTDDTAWAAFLAQHIEGDSMYDVSDDGRSFSVDMPSPFASQHVRGLAATLERRVSVVGNAA